MLKKEWYSAAELAGLKLPGMPTTERAIQLLAVREWQDRTNIPGESLARRRKGRGGGWEYHYTLLPSLALAKLVKDAQRDEAPVRPEGAEARTDDLWDWYERQPDKKKATARERYDALLAVSALEKGGMATNEAVHEIARQRGKSPRAVFNWRALVAGTNRADWLPALCPRHVGRTATVECDPQAWDWYKGHYLTRARPTHADTYARLQEIAASEGWAIPSARTLMRRLETEVDPIVATLCRDGIEKARAKLPTQERDATVFAAGEAVNGDGLKFDRLWVEWPDGEIINTSTAWFWQDIRTRRILAWRLDKTENTDVFRLATYDLTGVCAPSHVWLDNTTVAANKTMTASAPGRHRFHNKAEDGVGLLQMLGMEPHFTNPDRKSGNPGAKPVERAFGIGGLHEIVATNPTLIERGFSKKTAISSEELRQVIAQEVARHNARPGRRTQECGGVLSFDEAWEQATSDRPVRVLSDRQRRLLLMSREIVRADRAGVLTLKAGAIRGGLRNRYFSDACSRIAGRKVAVHFDPENLHKPVHVYGLDGRYLFDAEPWGAAGFADTKAGREHGKFKQRRIKALEKAADAESRMTALERSAIYAKATEGRPDPAAPTADPKVVEGHFRQTPDPERDALRAARVVNGALPPDEEPENFDDVFEASVASLAAWRREQP